MAVNERSSWIGFFDLLGTKDSSRVRRSDFPTHMDRFGRTIQQQAKNFTSRSKVRFFADCAYVECQEISELIQFCQVIRKILFSSDTYFKAAISPGQLDDVGIHGEGAKKGVDIEGYTFGPGVVPVYYAQEEFKGLGVRVLVDKNLSAVRDYLVESAFPKDDEGKGWTTFWDLAYTSDEVGVPVELGKSKEAANIEAEAFLDNLISAALRANANRKNLARYYISTLLTIIKSSDFSKIQRKEDGWDRAPVVFRHLVESKRRREGIMSIKGSESLYFAMTNEIFTGRKVGRDKYMDGRNDNLCNGAVQELLKLKLLSKPIANFPEAILSSDVRDNVASRSVKLRLAG